MKEENKKLLTIANEVLVSAPEDLKASRKDVFKSSIPDGFVYYDWQVPADGKLAFQGDGVRSLRLCFGNGKPKKAEKPKKEERVEKALIYKAYSLDQMALSVELIDGSSVVVPIRDHETFEKLFSAFQGASVQPKTTLKGRETSINWTDMRLESAYSPLVQDFYKGVHATVLDAIFKEVDDKKLTQIKIVDAGCGDGAFFLALDARIKVLKAGRNAVPTVSFIGVDTNERGIKKCERRKEKEMAEDPSFAAASFHAVDASDIDDVLGPKDQKETAEKTFVVFSGLLMRSVLSGHEALKTLQKASWVADYLIGGGEHQAYLNQRIGERLGFRDNAPSKTDVRSILDPQNYFSYAATPTRETKLQVRGNIADLSQMADPIKNLNRLKIPRDRPFTIDLSFSLLDDACVEKVKNLMEANPQLKLVFWHGDKEEMAKFKRGFGVMSSYDNQRVHSRLVEDDVYALASKSFLLEMMVDSELVQSYHTFLSGEVAAAGPVHFSEIQTYFKACVKFGLEVPKDHGVRYLELLDKQDNKYGPPDNVIPSILARKETISVKELNNFLRVIDLVEDQLRFPETEKLIPLRDRIIGSAWSGIVDAKDSISNVKTQLRTTLGELNGLRNVLEKYDVLEFDKFSTKVNVVMKDIARQIEALLENKKSRVPQIIATLEDVRGLYRVLRDIYKKVQSLSLPVAEKAIKFNDAVLKILQSYAKKADPVAYETVKAQLDSVLEKFIEQRADEKSRLADKAKEKDVEVAAAATSISVKGGLKLQLDTSPAKLSMGLGLASLEISGGKYSPGSDGSNAEIAFGSDYSDIGSIGGDRRGFSEGEGAVPGDEEEGIMPDDEEGMVPDEEKGMLPDDDAPTPKDDAKSGRVKDISPGRAAASFFADGAAEDRQRTESPVKGGGDEADGEESDEEDDSTPDGGSPSKGGGGGSPK